MNGGARAVRSVLFSIHPEHAAAIYTGAKRYEFRRCRVHLHAGDRVLIYETLPVGLVTGEFTVGPIYIGGAASLLAFTRNASGVGAATYLEGAVVATAISVVNPRKWATASSLEAVGAPTRAPQSYRFLDAVN